MEEIREPVKKLPDLLVGTIDFLSYTAVKADYLGIFAAFSSAIAIELGAILAVLVFELGTRVPKVANIVKTKIIWLNDGNKTEIRIEYN